MKGGARFRFVAGRRLTGSSVPAWPGADGEGIPDGPWYAWRLLGGNNRDLGRSPRVFASTQECRAAMEQLLRGASELVPVVIADADTGMWSWRLELNGVPVAVAARPYFRQREGQYNLSQFRTALPQAEIGDPGCDARPDERPATSWAGRRAPGRPV